MVAEAGRGDGRTRASSRYSAMRLCFLHLSPLYTDYLGKLGSVMPVSVQGILTLQNKGEDTSYEVAVFVQPGRLRRHNLFGSYNLAMAILPWS